MTLTQAVVSQWRSVTSSVSVTELTFAAHHRLEHFTCRVTVPFLCFCFTVLYIRLKKKNYIYSLNQRLIIMVGQYLRLKVSQIVLIRLFRLKELVTVGITA